MTRVTVVLQLSAAADIRCILMTVDLTQGYTLLLQKFEHSPSVLVMFSHYLRCNIKKMT
jgi:hypothetical protein